VFSKLREIGRLQDMCYALRVEIGKDREDLESQGHEMVSNDKAIETERVRLAVLRKQEADRVTQNAVLAKHAYAKRCWAHLYRHEAKKNRRSSNKYALKWDMQHPQYSWDEIIQMAHRSHYMSFFEAAVPVDCKDRYGKLCDLHKF
jgi:hypothetical protein